MHADADDALWHVRHLRVVVVVVVVAWVVAWPQLPCTSHAPPTHLTGRCSSRRSLLTILLTTYSVGRCSSRRCCSRRTRRSRRAPCCGSRAGSPCCCSARTAACGPKLGLGLGWARVRFSCCSALHALPHAAQSAPSALCPRSQQPTRPCHRPLWRWLWLWLWLAHLLAYLLTPNLALTLTRYCAYLVFQLHTHRHIFEDSKVKRTHNPNPQP